MLLMGDEVRRTQSGNNNAYCQDNPVSCFDWSLVNRNKEILHFVQLLIQRRLNRDSAQPEFQKSLNEMIRQGELIWHGIKLMEPDWTFHSSSLAVTLKSLSGSTLMHLMINAWKEPLAFEIPVNGKNRELKWKRWLDTSLSEPDDIVPWSKSTILQNDSYTVAERSVVVLIAVTSDEG
jgi:glycogen operon protein